MDRNRIKIERITDYDVALSVLKNETIASEIYEDTAALEIPDLIHEYWISAYVDNDLAGLYRIHCMGAVLWQIHCRILPEYRQKWAIKISRKALNWASLNIEKLQRIMCFVPVCHRNVKLHCLQVGFRGNGTLEKSYLKNGELIDQDILSIDIESMRMSYLMR